MCPTSMHHTSEINFKQIFQLELIGGVKVLAQGRYPYPFSVFSFFAVGL